MVDQTANFVRGEADSSIAAGDTTISVVDASEFPDPANGQYNLVLWDDSLGRPDQDDDAEIVRVTGRDTTNNNLTVARAQEGTSDVSHPSGSALQLSPTAKVIDDLAIGRFDSVEVFTADGTFDASGIDDVYVEVVGGGGGGGYRPTPTGSYTDMPGSGGGGGGGYCASYIDLSASSSVTATVGSGGFGGTSTSISGENGGDSSFGNFVEAGGGEGGSGAVENETAALGGNTGSPIKGDIEISGGQAGSGYTTGSVVVAGSGGSTVYAADRILPAVEVASSNPDNFFTTNTVGYGWGAPGMVSDGTSAFGGDGVVIVRY